MDSDNDTVSAEKALSSNVVNEVTALGQASAMHDGGESK
jgi:hypothetical protein